MHDGIEMERLGVPTASIITHVFLNTAKAMTRMMGVPDFEFVVAQHPLSSRLYTCPETAAAMSQGLIATHIHRGLRHLAADDRRLYLKDNDSQ